MTKDKKPDPDNRIDLFPVDKARSLLSATFVLVLAVVAAYFLWFRVKQGAELGGPAEWGQFGDYVGGLVNPILSFFALLVLILSLRASVRALQQNERILELSRLELERTTQQIEQNNDALAEQIKTVQNNALLERLASQAERISIALLWFQQNPDARDQGKRGEEERKNAPLGPDSSFRNIHSAFDVEHPTFSQTSHKRQIDEQRLDAALKSSLGRFVELSRLLNAVCDKAERIDPEVGLEFSGFYTIHTRQFAGLVRKGFCTSDELGRFVDPDLVEDPLS